MSGGVIIADIIANNTNAWRLYLFKKAEDNIPC